MHVIDQSVAAGSRTLASMAVRAGDVREINQREWRGCGFGGLFFPRFLGGFLACRPDSEQIDFVCLHVTLPKKKRKIVHRVHVNLLYAIDIATSTPNDKSRAIGNTGVWASRVVVQGQKRCRTWGSASYSGSGY